MPQVLIKQSVIKSGEQVEIMNSLVTFPVVFRSPRFGSKWLGFTHSLLSHLCFTTVHSVSSIPASIIEYLWAVGRRTGLINENVPYPVFLATVPFHNQQPFELVLSTFVQNLSSGDLSAINYSPVNPARPVCGVSSLPRSCQNWILPISIPLR